MHRRSSGSPTADDAEDTLVSRSAEPHYGPGPESSEKPRPEVARTGTSIDLRRDTNGNSTPRSRNSSTWRTLSSAAANWASPSPSPDTPYSATGAMPMTPQRLAIEASSDSPHRSRLSRLRSPWSCSILTAFTTIIACVFLFSIFRSYSALQTGSDGCGVPVMSPTFLRMVGFDTEHTRFASKYNLFLYREAGVDPFNQENLGVSFTRLCLVLRLTGCLSS